MAVNLELRGAVNNAIVEGASLRQIGELIKPQLNDMAAGAVDLSRIKPAVRHPLDPYTLYLADGICLHWWPITETLLEEEFPDNTVSPIHRHGWNLDNSIVLDDEIVNNGGY